MHVPILGAIVPGRITERRMSTWQLHFQHKDGTSTVRAQKDVNSIDEMQTFIKETKLKHSIPKGDIWMACNEDSRYFSYLEAGESERRGH